MFKTVSMPDSALPSALDTENALKVRYKTNLLLPTLGPLAVAGNVWPMVRIVLNLVSVSLLLDEIKNIRKNPTTVGFPVVVLGHGDDSIFFRPAAPSHPWFDRFVAPVREMVRKEKIRTKGRLGRNMSILSALSEPNVVCKDLFDRGCLIDAQGVVFNNKLMTMPKSHVAILSKVTPRREAFKDSEIKAVEPMVALALQQVERITQFPIQIDFKNNSTFRKQLLMYILDKLFHNPAFGRPWPVFDNNPALASKEWAFQRYETLKMGLGKPVLRGPVNATPVSPKSQLTLSEHESKAVFESYTQSKQLGKKVGFSSTSISSDRFQQALDNLSEHGISDENSFSQEGTLRSTLSDQRRQTIDRVSQEISSEVQEGSSSGRIQSTSRSSEYKTEGKDEKLSTTELKYQVVMPTHIQVFLDDVSVAWCPRVLSPFLKLHALVDKYEKEQKDLFLKQTYVPLPVRPVLKVDTRIEVFEVQIDGDATIKTKDFSRTFEFSDPNGYIDLDAITATHRNGTSDDFNWDERWNWDDLENARASLKNLSVSTDGKTLSGTAVLETTDPEWLNRSFITIKVPICFYTDETVAALQAYENALQEQSMKQEAINARATQYARLKRDELIEKYQAEFELKKEAFRALIARIFVNIDRRHHSYYEEIISRCINWDEASISFESQPMDQLPYSHLPPNHFMNCPAIRFFLPVFKPAEDTFFEAIKAGGISYHEQSAKKVRDYLEGYRDMIKTWKSSDTAKLLLDEYDSELQIGHHLEAVLSNYDFSS